MKVYVIWTLGFDLQEWWMCCRQAKGKLASSWALYRPCVGWAVVGRAEGTYCCRMLRGRPDDDRPLAYRVCTGIGSLWAWSRVKSVAGTENDVQRHVSVVVFSAGPELSPGWNQYWFLALFVNRELHLWEREVWQKHPSGCHIWLSYCCYWFHYYYCCH